ncbi:MAG: DNA-directed RNA polymerase subunit RPC12/RpoP [Planctomycetota bacterium]|jgi:DNA-directed RNA polymerase subunit RPC12/RpoP
MTTASLSPKPVRLNPLLWRSVLLVFFVLVFSLSLFGVGAPTEVSSRFALSVPHVAGSFQNEPLTDKEIQRLVNEKLRNSPGGFSGSDPAFPSPIQAMEKTVGFAKPFLMVFFLFFILFAGFVFFRIFKTMLVTNSTVDSLTSKYTDVLDRAKKAEAEESAPKKVGYNCSNCGAGLPPGADVSPSGDVKCTYCNMWFSIHQ